MLIIVGYENIRPSVLVVIYSTAGLRILWEIEEDQVLNYLKRKDVQCQILSRNNIL